MVRKKTFTVSAVGSSMYPLLQDGDIIEYTQTPIQNIKINDIILLYKNKSFISHRVIYRYKNYCVTRGDNNMRADKKVYETEIIGLALRFKRKGKWHSLQDVYLSQSTLYLTEIRKLEKLFIKHTIDHIYLKGILVSLIYEQTIPQRIYADCDLLVQRKNSKQIAYIFSQLGYVAVNLKNTDTIPYYKNEGEQPEISYVKHINKVPVVFDVHFEPVFLMSRLSALSLFYPQLLLTQLGTKLIKAKKDKRIGGQSYPMCSLPDQSLYLALHIFHHNCSESVRYALLDKIVRQMKKEDWSKLSKTINRYNLEGYTYIVFLVLIRYFDTPIPQSFFSNIYPSFFVRRASGWIATSIDIFNRRNRISEGMLRFLYIYLFSPQPFLKKTLIFFNPHFIFLVIWLIFNRIKKTLFRK